MTDLRLSVVVVSYGRPSALCRCLTALHQMRGGQVEVIVVADTEGFAALSRLPFSERLKCVPQDEPNISLARNLGLAQAAGDVVAFIDDDAVAVPVWAEVLLHAFAADPELAAATGPVLGRNGISTQWGPLAVDARGRDMALAHGDEALPRGTVRKLHGTNMAFRRSDILALGGFDPAFAYYLDDTDMALRLGRAGLKSTWIDQAVVHHGYAASTRRDADRVPLSLFDIGASTAIFLRKHADPTLVVEELAQLEHDQRTRLFRFARKRKLDPKTLGHLMESLKEGMEAGQGREFGTQALTASSLPFQALRETPAGNHVVLGGWRLQAPRLRRAAAAQVAQGNVVSLFLFEPSPRKHKVSFTDGGWWEQTGGTYGPSDRADPRLQVWTRKSRLSSEIARIRPERGLEEMVL